MVNQMICGGLIVAALLGGGLTIASTRATAEVAPTSPRLIFRGDTVANAISAGCYGPVGLYAGIDAIAPSRLSPGGVKRAARASRPAGAQIRINGKRYRLVIDRKVSGMAYHRVWWTFRRVRTSKSAARKLIGKTASISYRVGRRTYTTKRARVRDGNCE